MLLGEMLSEEWRRRIVRRAQALALPLCVAHKIVMGREPSAVVDVIVMLSPGELLCLYDICDVSIVIIFFWMGKL